MWKKFKSSRPLTSDTQKWGQKKRKLLESQTFEKIQYFCLVSLTTHMVEKAERLTLFLLTGIFFTVQSSGGRHCFKHISQMALMTY